MKYPLLACMLLIATILFYLNQETTTHHSINLGSFKVEENKVSQEEKCITSLPPTTIKLATTPPLSPKSTIYKADLLKGIIGISDSISVDNAFDNIFHITLDKQPTHKDEVWLIYDLNGISDHTAITRSINDRLAVGGYLVNKHNKWTTQKERLSYDWLRKGDNVLRFSLPKDFNAQCKIKNLTINIISNNEINTPKREIIFNLPNGNYYGNQAYFKGFLEGENKAEASLFIGTQKIENIDGEFEILLNKTSNLGKDWPIELVAVYPDGKEIFKKVILKSQTNKADFIAEVQQKKKSKKEIALPEQVNKIAAEGIQLIIPIGSIKQPEGIKIQPLSNRDIAPLPIDMVNVTPQNRGFRLLPDGAIFSKAIDLQIDFDSELIPAGYTAADIRTYYFDEVKRKWTQIPKKALCHTGNCLTSTTDHFTDFINGIIKIPESPETNGYTPTIIKDLKAANPSANIQQMEVPKPNNQGTVNLSMSIKIPAGRNGMQPQIALTYNNEGGNGWLGLGWDYSTPAISIETRWGVPRYDKDLETETYLLNGEQLTPLSHRDKFVPRYPKDQVFHRRVEGAFERIIRHGDTPKDYWWEVTDKNGTVNYYGGLPDGVVNNAVLKTDDDDNNNIAHWCLVMTKDANGNTVRYYYDTVDHYGIQDSTNLGKQIYIDRITYTGYEEEDGKYEVNFKRDSELMPTNRRYNRPDVNINCRLGFKQVTADLLRHIEVKFNGDLVRRYELDYQEGAFFKTLLSACREYDRKDSLFTEQRFAYFDEVRDGSNNYFPLENTKTWKVENDKIEADFKNPLTNTGVGNFDDKSSVLSASKSETKTKGLVATIGVGGNIGSKAGTIGGGRTGTKSDGKGLTTLTDINGDNLPDKVYKNGSYLFYRPNLFSPHNGLTEFGQQDTIFGNVSNFSLTNSKSKTSKFEANAGLFVGFTKNKGTTFTSTYFSDVNGDGLIDINREGEIYFNRINHKEKVEMKTGSTGTPSEIFSAGKIDMSLMDGINATQQELEEEFPLQDVVKMWEAPFDGIVSINAPIQLVNDTATISYQKDDGINAMIQYDNEIISSLRLERNDHQLRNFDLPSEIKVKAGKRIYFRLQSVCDGAFDQVIWQPEINYLDIPENEVDANGRLNGYYQSKEDFLLVSCQTVVMPLAGTITLNSVFEKPVTSDDVTVEIIKFNSGEIIYSNFIKWTDSIRMDINDTISVVADDEFLFRVSSPSNVDWSSIKWKPTIYYHAFEDTSLMPIDSTKRDTALLFKPTVEYLMFNKVIQKTEPIFFDKDTIQIYPPTGLTLSLFPNNKDGDAIMTLSAKGVNKLYGKSSIEFKSGLPISNFVPFEIAIRKGDSIYFEYHISNYNITKALNKNSLIVDTQIKGEVRKPVLAGIYSAIDPEESIFGNLYRGWGQFIYNGNGQRAMERINQSELELPDRRDVEEVEEDGTGFGDSDDPTNANFVVLIADAKENAWIGSDEFTYVKADTISSSRLGEDDIKLDSSMLDEKNMEFFLPQKISKSETKSWAGNIPLEGLKIPTVKGLAISKSDSDNKTILDVMDINGDRHPELVGVGKIQYTLPIGGLEDKVISHENIKNHVSSSKAESVNLGGTFASAWSFNSGVAEVNTSFGTPLLGGGGFSMNAKMAFKKAGATVSLGYDKGPVGESDDSTSDTWMDINGDGLVDRVKKDGKVRLNLGYKFLPTEEWNFEEIKSGDNKDYSEGPNLGSNYGNYSVSVGLSLSRTDSETTETLQDINGDGLVDRIVNDSPLKVRLNTGNNFAKEISWNGAEMINNSSSTGEAIQATFTGCFVIPIFVPIKICLNPQVSSGQGISRQHTQITDINGDGYPDFLKSNNDGHLEVKASTIGRTNMLKSVQQPMGSEFVLNYQRMGNTYEMPQSKWVMQEVAIIDGLTGDGPDTTKMRFAYKNGFQNRHERTFYGFEQVISEELDTKNQDAVYRTTIQTFDNSHYYRKGLLLKQQTFDGQGKPYLETANKYVFKDLLGNKDSGFDSIRVSIYPALAETTERYYEGQTTAELEQTMKYEYDALGNVIYYFDSGTKTENDSLWADIAYHDLNTPYIKSSPSSIEVWTDDGLERYRETSIDDFGNVTQIRQFLDANISANHDMTYDQYGNLESIQRPLNDSMQNLGFKYTYDSMVQTYVTKVEDSYGYSSENEYEYAFGQMLKSIDINKQEIHYTIDDRGRIKTITGPYELDSLPYTIAFDYDHTAVVPYARTRHYDPETGGDIVTVTFMDGLQRPIQVKKTGVVSSSDGLSETEKMIVSGRVIFDAFGRTVKTYYPTTENPTMFSVFNDQFDGIAPTKTEFDILDRPTKVTLPDNAVTQTNYSISPTNKGLMAFRTEMTDAEDKIRETFTDIRKRERAKGGHLGSGILWTNFDYNPISELTVVTDDGGNETTYKYDQLGRKTSMTHPATGETEYFYDLANNLTAKITADLRENISADAAIKYTYQYERLTQIDYPRNFQNRVQYHYGVAGDKFNRAGRIWLQEDASGGQEFFFGKLGEVEKNIRTIIVDPATQLTYVSQYEYDTWNRLQEMVYPDGEKLIYDYNVAGKLIGMQGVKDSTTYNYVNQLRYDKFEQRTYLEFGNGTTTHYQYEDDRRRLQHLQVMGNENRQIINNTYTYDEVDNIEVVENNVQAMTGGIGGYARQEYEYDDLYRLTSAIGEYQGGKNSSTYMLNMTYDNLHNIQQKEQMHFMDGVLSQNLTYDLNYKYEQDRPHVPDSIGTVDYRYDPNGNMTYWKDTFDIERQFYWDEENRLKGVYINEEEEDENGNKVKKGKQISEYTYDASGERVIKSDDVDFEGAFVNGTPVGFVRHDTNYVLYVNPYLVVNKTRFTKHYFIEGQRITSKIGIGSFKNNMIAPNRGITAGNKNFVQRLQSIEDSIRTISSAPGHPTIPYYYTDPVRSNDPFPVFQNGNYDRPNDRWPQRRLDPDTTKPPGHPTIFETEDITNDNVTAGYGYLGHPIVFEGEQFFYHPDHLGSSNYLTDLNGAVRQHTEYTAFGESFVDEHTSSSTQPYKYNGKELDDATGLYYYGARYYDPRILVWQSTDPLMEKYAGWSPYHYTLLNPIKYVDPDGKKSEYVGSKNYYLLMENDFKSKNNESGKKPPSYYSNYGDKYIRRFNDKLKPQLSKEGQKWVEKTTVNLQNAIENIVNNNPNIEQNSEEFKNLAFDSHPKAYLDAGLLDLPILDKIKIGLTPDLSDILSPKGLKQVKEIGNEQLKRLGNDFKESINNFLNSHQKKEGGEFSGAEASGSYEN